MNKWNKPASHESLEKTIEALKQNGIHSIVVENEAEAKAAVLDLLPKEAEVMTMTSVTLAETGLDEAIDASGDYDSVKVKLAKMDRAVENSEMQRIGAAPEWAVGSVHAVTEEGQVLIASNTGSQLPAYAYGASNVIWVVGTQKIVDNLDQAMKRLYEHTLPLESERAHIAYGVEGSHVSKMLIVDREVKPNRITIVFIKKAIGY